MKKVMFAVALATFVFTSCSEAQKENTAAAHSDSHAGHAHEDSPASAEMPAAGKVVVAAPDYSASGEPVKSQVKQLLTSYLQLKDELIAGDAQGAKTQAQTILAAVGKVRVAALGAEQQAYAAARLDEIKDSAGKIQGAADIGEQRANLELLAEATFALTKAFGATSQELFYQHCPMASDNQGAYWLSASQEIRNPYFGKEMLNCGNTEEVYNN